MESVIIEKQYGQPLLGALVQADGVLFRVWAPNAKNVDLIFQYDDIRRPLDAVDGDYFETLVKDCKAGERYYFSIDQSSLMPDPASRFQPEGVHGPSQVVDPSEYQWNDAEWPGVERSKLVFYELHVGTFSSEGTYRGVQQKLPHLKSLGVTAIELMPLGEFAGRWNWGYDAVALYAPFHGYGSPDDLRALVDAAHSMGMAVYLDVVYNHFGPDGCYAISFGKFFSEKHHSPWGQGINLDDLHSEGVRNYFIGNALHWLNEYHFDGLRLDATHTLLDESDFHFLAQLRDSIDSLEGPHRYLIAEDARNDAQLIRLRSEGGFGLHGVWSDDFHHQVRNLIAGDDDGYFAGFSGTTAEEIAANLKQGWFHAGQPSRNLREPRGSPTGGLSLEHFVIYIQNHDQIGNRATGERLNHDVSLSMYRTATALLLFVPETPLLFMGQEWAASTPFCFFTDHHQELGRLVSEGRKQEFGEFAGFKRTIPDPQDPQTFKQSKLNWDELEWPNHANMLNLYRDLLQLRRALEGPFDVIAHGEKSLTLKRGHHGLLVALGENLRIPLADSPQILLTTEDERYTSHSVQPVREAQGVYFAQPSAIVYYEK